MGKMKKDPEEKLAEGISSANDIKNKTVRRKIIGKELLEKRKVIC